MFYTSKIAILLIDQSNLLSFFKTKLFCMIFSNLSSPTIFWSQHSSSPAYNYFKQSALHAWNGFRGNQIQDEGARQLRYGNFLRAVAKNLLSFRMYFAVMFHFLQFWRVPTMFMSPWSMSSACLLCGWLWVLASMRRTLSWKRTILVAREDAEDHVGNNCSGITIKWCYQYVGKVQNEEFDRRKRQE